MGIAKMLFFFFKYVPFYNYICIADDFFILKVPVSLSVHGSQFCGVTVHCCATLRCFGLVNTLFLSLMRLQLNPLCSTRHVLLQ